MTFELDPASGPPSRARHSWQGKRGAIPHRRRKGWLVVIAVILVAVAALVYYRVRSATTPTAGNPANSPGAEGPNTTAITGVPPPVHPGSIATIGAIADPGATCTFA